MNALTDFESSGEFSDREKLAIRYAEMLTVTPVEVPDDFFGQLRREFTEVQLVDLTSAIAWENYRARFNHAFGIESANFCKLPAFEGTSASPAGETRSTPLKIPRR